MPGNFISWFAFWGQNSSNQRKKLQENNLNQLLQSMLRDVSRAASTQFKREAAKLISWGLQDNSSNTNLLVNKYCKLWEKKVCRIFPNENLQFSNSTVDVGKLKKETHFHYFEIQHKHRDNDTHTECAVHSTAA